MFDSRVVSWNERTTDILSICRPAIIDHVRLVMHRHSFSFCVVSLLTLDLRGTCSHFVTRTQRQKRETDRPRDGRDDWIERRKKREHRMIVLSSNRTNIMAKFCPVSRFLCVCVSPITWVRSYKFLPLSPLLLPDSRFFSPHFAGRSFCRQKFLFSLPPHSLGRQSCTPGVAFIHSLTE